MVKTNLRKSIKSKITRISVHCLNIERGRYNKPKIPREEQFCKFCTDIDIFPEAPCYLLSTTFT
jgi:hypothetical protein